MAHQIYDEFLYQLTLGDIDLDASGEIKVILCDALPTTTLSDYTDITTELSTANGYTAGGQALANIVVTKDTGEITFDADDVTWTLTGEITARCAVLYHDNSSNATNSKPLLMCYDFAEDKVDTSSFVIEWNNVTNALFKLTG